MTATEMEEQATVNDAIETFQLEMRELFSDYNRHVSLLHERTQEQLKMIAALLADISQRLPPRA